MAGLALAIRLEAGYELYEFDTLMPTEAEQRKLYVQLLKMEWLRIAIERMNDDVPQPDDAARRAAGVLS